MAAPQTDTRIMRPMTVVQVRAHLQRTLKRALEMDLASRVTRIDYGAYSVPSTSRGGIAYLITGKEGEALTCTCEAQWHMPLCVHRAAVLIRRWESEGYTVRVNERGDVTRVTEEDASDLAYPIHQWPALIQDAPPVYTRPPDDDPDDDLVLEIDDA
jgi:hypothetical protein